VLHLTPIQVEELTFMSFADKNILVTGGVGSLGSALVKRLLEGQASRIVVYDINQSGLDKMERECPDERLRFFVGDVRDLERLKRAMETCHIVIHTAAYKIIPSCEYNPSEAIKTNILGSKNVVEATLGTETVEKVVAISSDKACSPLNLYGATKLCMERIFVAANYYKGKRKARFFCTTPDTPIVTIHGFKKIAEVKKGDLVLTHKGRFKPVTEVFTRPYRGVVYHINIGKCSITVTPEHPLLGFVDGKTQWITAKLCWKLCNKLTRNRGSLFSGLYRWRRLFHGPYPQITFTPYADSICCNARDLGFSGLESETRTFMDSRKGRRDILREKGQIFRETFCNPEHLWQTPCTKTFGENFTILKGEETTSIVNDEGNRDYPKQPRGFKIEGEVANNFRFEESNFRVEFDKSTSTVRKSTDENSILERIGIKQGFSARAVMNLEVEDDHTFFTGPFISHNCTRYGNVLGSADSVIPIWKEQVTRNSPLTLTKGEMTRFNITMQEGIDFIFRSLQTAYGGEIFVPKLKAYRVRDLLEAFNQVTGSNCTVQEIPVRPGEKPHEQLINEFEMRTAVTFGPHEDYAILPDESTIKRFGLRFYFDEPVKFPEPVAYSSETAEKLTVDELKQLLKSHGD